MDQPNKVEELQANAQAAQMQNTHISPREPEAWTRQLQEITKQIYPIIEWHDELMKSISEFIENIPILPDLIEQLQGISATSITTVPLLTVMKNRSISSSSPC